MNQAYHYGYSDGMNYGAGEQAAGEDATTYIHRELASIATAIADLSSDPIGRYSTNLQWSLGYRDSLIEAIKPALVA